MSEKEKTMLDMLQEDVEAESGDNDKYIELAKRADEEYPGRGYGGILRDIAHEETTHHKYLMAIIKDIRKHEEHG